MDFTFTMNLHDTMLLSADYVRTKFYYRFRFFVHISVDGLGWKNISVTLVPADWGCLAGCCTSLCLQVAPAALVSDEKHIGGVYARCAIQIDTFTFFYF